MDEVSETQNGDACEVVFSAAVARCEVSALY